MNEEDILVWSFAMLIFVTIAYCRGYTDGFDARDRRHRR